MKIEDLPFKCRYFSSYPVEDVRKAVWFSKPITYSVMDLLWKAGPKGLTPQEVYELLKEQKQDYGKSQVYQTLRDLYAGQIVDRKYDSATGAHKHMLQMREAPAFLDDDFVNWFDGNLSDFAQKILFPAFLTFLAEVMKVVREKKVPRAVFPIQGKDGWCDGCEYSHEAEQFFLAMLYSTALEFTTAVGAPEVYWDHFDANSIVKFYKENKFADPEAELEFAEDNNP